MTKHNSIFVFLLNDDERMADSGSNKEQNDDKRKNADPIQQDNEKNNTNRINNKASSAPLDVCNVKDY